MVHFPMEPSVASADPGPNALLRSLDPAEIERRLQWGLVRFDGYVGVNNHMGSAFTEDAKGMGIVLRELEHRGLMFLDSRTTRSEEHTSELQSLMRTSYAVFCLKKKT